MSARRGLAILVAVWTAGVFALFATAAPSAEPASEPKPEGDRWALLIGINEYQAAGRLQFCREDAQALGKVLVERGGFNPDRVVVLADGGAKPEDWPTRGNIRRRIEQFSRLTEADDTVLVFFSGHGMMVGGKGYLMAVDSDRDPANSISLDWVKERLATGKAKTKLLVLDVCHAGSAKDVGGLAPSLVGIAGLTVLASCAADEISYVEEEAKSGVFAGRLVEGLAGAADADGDKVVTVAELHAFVKRSMKDWCLKTGKTQRPFVAPETPPPVALAYARGKPFVRPSALRVPEGFRAAEGTQAEPYTKTGWAKEIVHEATGIELVFIPVGEFLMGSPASEAQRNDDETQHRVIISRPFYLGKYEVTQGEWQRVMGSNPSNFKGSDRLPVEQVSWDDCQAFLRKAGGGLRLPTEAEWEYACRAGTTTPFHTGATISPSEANYNGNYIYGGVAKGAFRQKTTEVGSFRPNAWGLFDMHGNVWEWCADWYGDYLGGAVTDPMGPASGTGRVLRGGSWFGRPRGCRSARRFRFSPGYRFSFLGFRVALDLK
ncbi:MAG: SUMF1/EgtB/PvdO family nonheme iron enzyme [Phycisphaerae bacterium]